MLIRENINLAEVMLFGICTSLTQIKMSGRAIPCSVPNVY